MVDPCERNPLHPRRTAAARWGLLLAPTLALFCGAGCAVTTVDSRVQSQAEPIPAQSTLAVVPFENLSSSRNAGLALTDLATSILYGHDYFRIVEISGLQEEKELRFRRLETAPWERQVGVNPAAAAAVGRSAKADCVLAGAVGEYGFVDGFGETAAVSVTLRLVRSANAEVVWAGSLSRRVASSAFSEESAQRLAHEVLRDLLGRMIRELTGDGR